VKVRGLSPCSGLCAGLVLATAAACRDSNQAQVPHWPQGTVLVLGERPIGAAEVDEAANLIAQLEPRDSIDQLRRLALTNAVLPRCAAEAIDPEARAAARGLAQNWKLTLATGLDPAAPPPAPQLQERKGPMLKLGLELWGACMALEPGQWTPVIETAGCFHIARVKQKGTAMLPGLVELTLDVYDFPYLVPERAHDQIEAQLDRSRIVYVDEAWRALVPLAWQHRFRGGTP